MFSEFSVPALCTGCQFKKKKEAKNKSFFVLRTSFLVTVVLSIVFLIQISVKFWYFGNTSIHNLSQVYQQYLMYFVPLNYKVCVLLFVYYVNVCIEIVCLRVHYLVHVVWYARMQTCVRGVKQRQSALSLSPHPFTPGG